MSEPVKRLTIGRIMYCACRKPRPRHATRRYSLIRLPRPFQDHDGGLSCGRLAAGFQNSGAGLDLGVYAARSYSLMRPPRTGLRLIRPWESGGVVGPGRVQLPAAMGSSAVVVGLVLGHHDAQVPLAEDQHPVGDLGSRGEDARLRKPL